MSCMIALILIQVSEKINNYVGFHPKAVHMPASSWSVVPKTKQNTINIGHAHKIFDTIQWYLSQYNCIKMNFINHTCAFGIHICFDYLFS